MWTRSYSVSTPRAKRPHPSSTLLDNDPASASAGRDLQLEKAIEVLKKEIGEKPFTFPPRPAYPVR